MCVLCKLVYHVHTDPCTSQKVWALLELENQNGDPLQDRKCS